MHCTMPAHISAQPLVSNFLCPRALANFLLFNVDYIDILVYYIDINKVIAFDQRKRQHHFKKKRLSVKRNRCIVKKA